MNIVLGITGSIAAVKAPALISLLKKQGHSVRVVLTKGGCEFVTPMACQALSGEPIYLDFETAEHSNAMDHIALARWADILLIAPASAHVLALCAHGLSDQLLNALFLATKAPVWMAPAMNTNMWEHPATQDNIQRLTTMNVQWIQPTSGVLACGEVGPGRMAEPEVIVETLFQARSPLLALKGLHILITAGATQEPIDPMRFISNHSTGTMGLSLAQAALEQGAHVTCILGPSTAAIPKGITPIHVKTADEMHAAVMSHLAEHDWFIACAAVSDYTPITTHPHKLKKSNTPLQIDCQPTKDILKAVCQSSNRPTCIVGFAAETERLIELARQKKINKGCDMIVANLIQDARDPSHEHQATLITEHTEYPYPRMTKLNLARQLIQDIAHHAPQPPSTSDSN